MSKPDPVTTLLSKLNASGNTIATAYHQGRIHKSEDNARDIEKLRHMRLLSPDIRDAFQLRGSFRQFLNAALNTEKLFSAGANIGGHFLRLTQLVDEHSFAFQEGRDTDVERYEVETREAVSDIADAIEDELVILQAQVTTRFAAVSTIAEKKRQNVHFQKRTAQLVDLLESFHFSDIGEILDGHENLALSFRSLLANRIPAFREALISILVLLNQYLFEYRNIEERAKRIRAFALHLNRHGDWQPLAWDEVLEPELWLKHAAPIAIASSPDVSNVEMESQLISIAKTVSGTAAFRNRALRPPGQVEGASGNVSIRELAPLVRVGVRLYFRAARNAVEGISAREWWAKNSSSLGSVSEHIWLLRVLAEHDNKGATASWSLRTNASRGPLFTGNVLIHDVIVSRKTP